MVYLSKVCIVIIQDYINPTVLKRRIDDLMESFGLGVFYEQPVLEPFMSAFCKEYSMICSLADNNKYDNCERFLLPDNCFYNGNTNSIPFMVRMSQLECLLRMILKVSKQVDVFIGNSGTLFDEYEHYQIGINEFADLSNMLNSFLEPNIHFAIMDTE